MWLVSFCLEWLVCNSRHLSVAFFIVIGEFVDPPGYVVNEPMGYTIDVIGTTNMDGIDGKTNAHIIIVCGICL